MRPEAPAPKPVYKHQEFPKCLYPGTALLARGIKPERTKQAKDEVEQAFLEKEGYQTTQAAAPVVAHSATKEEALAQQQAVFDAAWKTKQAEVVALTAKVEHLTEQVDNLKAEREALNRRLAKLTEKPKEAKSEAA